MRELETKLDACDDISNNGPECDEGGDSFKPVECMKALTTCVLGGFRDFVNCVKDDQ